MSRFPVSTRLSPEVRASIFHFTVFGSTGVASVYFGIWLKSHGVAESEIGIINALPLIAMLMVNVLIGRLADKASDWRVMIIGLSVLAGIAPALLFFVSGFWAIAAAWVLIAVPTSAMVPIVDAATMRMTERRGTDFAAVRAWGTLGYMAATAGAGPLIGYLGGWSFVPLVVGLALVRVLASLQLPVFRGEAARAQAKPVVPPEARAMLRKPWFMAALIGIAMLYGSHSALGAFGALQWLAQGIPEGVIGLLIATMAAAEAAMMFLWKRIRLRVSARHLVMIASLVAAARWVAMAFQPPLYVLFALQLLHSITFAVGYLAGMYFIANWTDDTIAAEAQGFSYVLQQATSILVLIGMGALIAAFGSAAWIGLGAFAGCGAVLVWVSLRMQPKQGHPVDQASLDIADPMA
jgi:PPP family 3-phenylpropionic acid transporter